MLDGRTAVLLQKINEWCADGKYKVLEREDFLSAFPAYLQEEEGVDGMLSYLAEHEYIDIRYSDRERGVYCLYPLPAGRLYAERIRDDLQTERSALRKNLLVSFLGGLAGALIGSGVVAVVALWV
jgi:hypothetical protein